MDQGENHAKKKKVHFIGICGVGMAGTAKLLLDQGFEISGSDEGFYPPMADYIRTLPFTLHEGYAKENIPPDAELIVIGKSARLTKDRNEEVRAALASTVPTSSFPEVISTLTGNTKNIVVAGSYGKSTVTALISWCLLHAGKDPSYFIGAIPLGMKETSRLGKSDLFVLEGDEYPTSNTDPTSKFMYYHPRDVVLTSADHDHYDQFPTHEDFLARFRLVLGTIPDDGLLIACSDNAYVRELVMHYSKQVIRYGLLPLHNPAWTAEDIVCGETATSFSLINAGTPIAHLTTKLLGKHNVQNICGAAAILLERNLLSVEEFQKAIASFGGITRRLDKKTDHSRVLIYEGFGSSYQKARAAIDAVKDHHPSRALIVIFEPHTFSWRRRDSLSSYRTLFEGSSDVILYHESEKRMHVEGELTPEEMIAQVKEAHIPITLAKNPDEAIAILQKTLQEENSILILSSGGMSGLIPRVIALAEEKFPK